VTVILNLILALLTSFFVLLTFYLSYTPSLALSGLIDLYHLDLIGLTEFWINLSLLLTLFAVLLQTTCFLAFPVTAQLKIFFCVVH